MDSPQLQAIQMSQQQNPLVQQEQQDQAVDDAKRKQMQQQMVQQTPNVAAVSQALGALNDKSKPGQIGKAIQDPSYAGYCQQFVDDKTGATQRYPTAAATWDAKVQSGQAQTDVSKAKPGDVIEFAPDQTNGNMGHAALVTPDGNLQMATYNGVQTFSLDDWTKYSSQTPVGYYTPSK